MSTLGEVRTNNLEDKLQGLTALRGLEGWLVGTKEQDGFVCKAFAFEEVS